MVDIDNCPVCHREHVPHSHIESAIPYASSGTQLEDRTHTDVGKRYECPTCGTFVVTRADWHNLTSPRGQSRFKAYQLSALLREQSIRGTPYWLRDGMDPYGQLEETNLAPIDLPDLLNRWPRTIPERLDRILCNLARSSPRGGAEVFVPNSEVALVFSETLEEVGFYLDSLVTYGLLAVTSASDENIAVVTAKGWERFDQLTRGASAPENPAFVAMWFADSEDAKLMAAAYREGIEPGIMDAGYLALRVDQQQFNDDVMDKVLAGIRAAPFVVADCTGHRNGVYFEAGFARGLGTPVIHTCHADHMGKTHFDTRQLNHIVWKKPEELREKLRDRILGTIGRGPHPPAKKG